MKKVLFLVVAVLISMVMTSCYKNCPAVAKINTMDSLWTQHTLYECVVLKGTETNVDVHVKKGEKPEGIYASGGNFFWVNFVDENSPEEIQIPNEVPQKNSNDFSIQKVKRSYIVILKERETVDYAGKYGFIVRTWDRAIRVRYIYEE